MDMIEALKSENESLKNVLSATNAEKTAIDQCYLISLKDNIQLRAQIVLMQEHMKKQDHQLIDLKKEIDDLKKSNIENAA